MGNQTKIHIKLKSNNTIRKSNHTLFADDAAIDIANLNDTKLILNTYKESATEYHLIIQWAKVLILTKQKLIENHLHTLHPPYKKIQCATTCKILGHMATDDTNLTTAVYDRLQKRNAHGLNLGKPSQPTQNYQ